MNVNGQGKLNMPIIFESVVMLLTKNYQNGAWSMVVETTACQSWRVFLDTVYRLSYACASFPRDFSHLIAITMKNWGKVKPDVPTKEENIILTVSWRVCQAHPCCQCCRREDYLAQWSAINEKDGRVSDAKPCFRPPDWFIDGKTERLFVWTS